MNFRQCMESGLLSETDQDPEGAQELCRMADHRTAFWREVKGAEQRFPALFLEGHYEIIKEFALAILLREGWKAQNHDCAFQFLEEKGGLRLDFSYLAELRRLRNRISYEGASISPDVWFRNKFRVEQLISDLRQRAAGLG